MAKSNEAKIRGDEKPAPLALLKPWREAMIAENSIGFGIETCFEHVVSKLSDGEIIEIIQKGYVDQSELPQYESDLVIFESFPEGLLLK